MTGNCFGCKGFFDFDGFIAPGRYRFYITRLFIYNINALLGIWCWVGFDLLCDGVHYTVGYGKDGPRVWINLILFIIGNIGLVSTGTMAGQLGSEGSHDDVEGLEVIERLDADDDGDDDDLDPPDGITETVASVQQDAYLNGGFTVRRPHGRLESTQSISPLLLPIEVDEEGGKNAVGPKGRAVSVALPPSEASNKVGLFSVLLVWN